MKRGVLLVLAANLVAASVLVFAYPHLIIAPSPLIEGHREYATDCFACHRTFFGTPAANCIACQKVEDVGLRTTRGVPIGQTKLKVSFHQRLIEQDCVARHSDHRGVAKYRVGRRFSHASLQAAVRAECAGCHRGPDDALHRQITGNCKESTPSRDGSRAPSTTPSTSCSTATKTSSA